jgi:hypothetical protein
MIGLESAELGDDHLTIIIKDLTSCHERIKSSLHCTLQHTFCSVLISPHFSSRRGHWENSKCLAVHYNLVKSLRRYIVSPNIGWVRESTTIKQL